MSTGVYVIHMTVHKLLMRKAGQPAAEQHVNNQCHYDPYGQYHEMRQLHQQQETLMPVTPAHTALNNELLNKYSDKFCYKEIPLKTLFSAATFKVTFMLIHHVLSTLPSTSHFILKTLG